MQINLEKNDLHAIQSYTSESVTINGTTYDTSLIVSNEQLISPWQVTGLSSFTTENFKIILDLKPEVIIIGHTLPYMSLPMPLMIELSKYGLGVECMTLGAACRTFNVLLSERRAVALGIILN